MLLRVFARIRPKPEFADQVREALRAIDPFTITEAGWMTFTSNAGVHDRTLYLFEG